MENTDEVFLPTQFKDDQPQWYIASGEKWIGPLRAADVYQQVIDGQITLAHYVWKPGQKEWKRICDTETFQAAVPTPPGKNIQSEVKEASAPAKPVVKKAAKRVAAPQPPAAPVEEEERNWFLYYNNSQFGPFSHEEVARFVAIGKITPQVHAWSEGMAGWERIEKIEDFKGIQKTPAAREKTRTAISAKPADNRQTPRAPMVAKIFVANEDAVLVGVCRDVSVGGMQVLTDHMPGKVGQRIKLNVSPPHPGSKKKDFDPFVAEGVIVRMLEDGRGFSFRFEKLPEASKKSIEKYLSGNS